MCTASNHTNLVAAFDNDRLGLSSNVRQLPGADDYEVSVVDAFSGNVMFFWNFNNKELALQTAKSLINIGGQMTLE